MVTRNIREVRTSTKFTFRPGGYTAYWIAYSTMIDMAEQLGRRKAKMKLMLYASFPWYCVIKPLGQFFVTVTTYKGTYKVIDDKTFMNVSVVKRKTFKLFFIPLFTVRSTKLNDVDKQRLLS